MINFEGERVHKDLCDVCPGLRSLLPGGHNRLGNRGLPKLIRLGHRAIAEGPHGRLHNPLDTSTSLATFTGKHHFHGPLYCSVQSCA